MLRDLACAALGWLLAACAWVGASRLQRSMLSDEFGAEGLPKGLAILLAAVSTLIAVRALWQNRGRSPILAGTKSGSVPGFALHAKALGIVAIGFAYVLLAPWSGYLPAAALLIFATGVHYGARPSVTLALVSAGGATLLWLVFARMLSVSMPAGLWPRLFG
jgi:hypothetical protein